MAVAARPTTRSRRRTPASLECFEELRELRHFYRSKARLVGALGWKPSTADDWLRGAVARPRLEHRAQVRRLLALARKADAWTSEPHVVGDWTLEQQAALAGQSPSDVLRVLGDEGLEQLLRNLAEIAPRTAVGNPKLPSADQLRAALAQTLGDDTRVLAKRAAGAPEVVVDLSDFD